MNKKLAGLILSAFAGAILILPAACSGQTNFKLASAGRPEAVIVLAPNAPIAEKTAAKELAFYLNKVTGAAFKTCAPGVAPKNMRRIWVGQSAQAAKIAGKIDWKKLKHDGIVIHASGNDLVLAGDRPRGSLYAVYSFLEDSIGCKWWTSKSDYAPLKPNLTVSVKNLVHVPPFMYRESYYYDVNHQNLEFASKLRLNGTYQSVPPELGGHYKLIGFVHTFDELLPASKYFGEHPEWYSLVNGQRVGGQEVGQLCLTNPEMKAEMIKQALAAIAKDPTAGMISISQNDNISYCQCEKCAAIAKAEGSQSGPLIRFVNDVADEINKKYPDFLVETLAYLHTRHAPKLVKPRPNVIVRLCSIECNFAEPLDSPSNALFYKDLQDWKKLSKRLYVWDYVVNFANLTINHPNWQVLDKNIKIFQANNVVGLFEQGDGYNKDGNFSHMKLWVLSKLMWNSKLDRIKLMQEFVRGYYGNAAPFLMQYLDLNGKAVVKNKVNLLCNIGGFVEYLSQADMDRATELFDKAQEAVKNNEELSRRVRIERLALDHTWLLQTQLDRSLAGKSIGLTTPELFEKYVKAAFDTGNYYVGENGPLTDPIIEGMRIYANMPYMTSEQRQLMQPEVTKGLSPADWADMQELNLKLHRPGQKSFVEADAEASDGVTVRMPGNTNDWSAQMYTDKTGIAPGTKIDIYARVKVKRKAGAGLAFTTGIYDEVKAIRVLDRSVMLEDIADDNYHDYKLGTYTVEPGWFVYVAPPGNELVDNVYVDRMFVVKQ